MEQGGEAERQQKQRGKILRVIMCIMYADVKGDVRERVQRSKLNSPGLSEEESEERPEKCRLAEKKGRFTQNRRKLKKEVS